MTEEEFTRRIMAMRNRLYHVGRAMLWNDEDAADAVQEAMLAAWKQRRALRDEDKFEAWFMRVFINRCRDMRRGRTPSGATRKPRRSRATRARPWTPCRTGCACPPFCSTSRGILRRRWRACWASSRSR